jgi:hypothetical protein
MNKLLWSSSLALATAAFLTACGDELCDGEAYDPTKYDCVDNEKQEKKTCKGIQYNPENEFCAMRGSVEIGTYKMVTIVATTNNVHFFGAPLNPRMKKTLINTPSFSIKH